MSATARLVICLSVLAALAGCSQPARPVESPRDPTFVCTPLVGSPGPCNQVDWHEQDEQNKLYDEAKAVYLRFNAEEERIFKAGGITEPTAVLKETVTSSQLKQLMDEYHDQQKQGMRLAKGGLRTVWIKPDPGKHMNDSVATISVCLDTSGNEWRDAKSTYRAGGDGQGTYYFVRDGELLKIDSSDGKDVKTC